MKYAFLILVVAGLLAAQSNIPSPVNITGTGTTYIDVTPGACPTLASQPSTIPGAYRLCTQNGQLLMDSGSGYAPLAKPMTNITITCVKGGPGLPSGLPMKGCSIQ